MFLTAERWKQPKCSSTNEWINNLQYEYVCIHIHTMEYYPAVKRNEVLLHAIIWMNTENILLSERSQSGRTTCYNSIHNKMSRTEKSTETARTLMVAWTGKVGL